LAEKDNGNWSKLFSVCPKRHNPLRMSKKERILLPNLAKESYLV